MTSTEFTIGMTAEARSSSKVLKPPGGGSSDIFGNTEVVEKDSGDNKQETQTKDKDRLCGPVDVPTPTKQDRNKSDIFGVKPETCIRPNKKKYIQRNPITGEMVEIDLEKNGDKEKADEEKNGDKEKADEEKNGDKEDGEREKGDEEKDVQDIGEQKVKEETANNKVADVNEETMNKPPKPTSIRVRQPPGGASSGIF